MGVIIFNNKSSTQYGIQVEIPPDYITPERDYESIHVPGKNGDILVDSGSYRNTNRTYNISVGGKNKAFTTMANDISEWLNSSSGYVRLEDSYEPEYYRLATYKNAITVGNIYGQAGRASISFECKPQRYLKIGDVKTSMTKTTVINNPTNFKALPIIKVNGSGTLRVGSYVVSISANSPTTTIDSEIQDCYAGTINRNSSVTLPSGFPKLLPGNNEISFSGGITSVDVTPKWWTL